MRGIAAAGLVLAGALAGLLVARWMPDGQERPYHDPGPQPALDREPARERSHPDPGPADRATGPRTSDATEDPERPAEAACPPVPACPACAACPACPACPECPPAEIACAADRTAVAKLQDALGQARREVGQLEEKAGGAGRSGPRQRYDDPTVQGRRRLAAEQENLLLEIPAWGWEDGRLPEDVLARLSPEDRATLERLYDEARVRLTEELRRIYGELQGDPAAGAGATLNGLVHDIIDLADGECRTRMVALVEALAGDSPLPPITPSSPACEKAILTILLAVDGLEQAVRLALGDPGVEALWSGTSSFEFSAGGH